MQVVVQLQIQPLPQAILAPVRFILAALLTTPPAVFMYKIYKQLVWQPTWPKTAPTAQAEPVWLWLPPTLNEPCTHTSLYQPMYQQTTSTRTLFATVITST